MDSQYNCSNSEGLKGQLCCYFCKFLSFEITHFSQIFLQISFQEVGSRHNEGTYDERQRAIRQSNFGKRQGGARTRWKIAGCFSVIYWRLLLSLLRLLMSAWAKLYEFKVCFLCNSSCSARQFPQVQGGVSIFYALTYTFRAIITFSTGPLHFSVWGVF